MNGLYRHIGPILGAALMLLPSAMAHATDACGVRIDFSVEKTGEYLLSFWTAPIHLDDMTVATHEAVIDEDVTGRIMPGEDGWSYCGFNGGEPVHLTAGNHTVFIKGVGPALPNVESLSVSEEGYGLLPDASAYEAFMAKARRNIGGETVSQMSLTPGSIDLLPTSIPLQYTYYTRLKLKKGEEADVSVSSAAAHYIDMMYEYTDTLSVASGSKASLPPGIGADGGNTSVDGFKAAFPYIPASARQRQVLNWQARSEADAQTGVQKATLSVKAPLSGHYLVRVRCRDNKALSTADVTVNGSYTTRSVPISFNGVSYRLPSDGEEYQTFIWVDDTDNDDALLFIHGADADRVVAYNDDAPAELKEGFSLCGTEPGIKNEYMVPTTFCSVSSFASHFPESTCQIGFFHAAPEEARKIRGIMADSPAGMEKVRDESGIRMESRIEGGTLRVEFEPDSLRMILVTAPDGRIEECIEIAKGQREVSLPPLPAGCICMVVGISDRGHIVNKIIGQ